VAEDTDTTGVNVVMVHKDEIVNLWPQIAPHFQRVLERNQDTITPKAFYDRCVRGDYLIIVATRGDEIMMAMASELVTCDTGKKILLIPQLSGYDMSEWLNSLVAQLYRIADELGCFKVMICGARKGWAKEMIQHGGYVDTVTVEFDVKANIAKYKD